MPKFSYNTPDAYERSIQNLRKELSSPFSSFDNLRALRQSGSKKDVTLVNLSKPSNSTNSTEKKEVSLVLLNENLYVVGFVVNEEIVVNEKTVINQTFYFFNDNNDEYRRIINIPNPNGDLVNKKNPVSLNISSDYNSLGNEEREKAEISLCAINNAIINLLNYDKGNIDIKKSLIILITVVVEAVRLSLISDAIKNKLSSENKALTLGNKISKNKNEMVRALIEFANSSSKEQDSLAVASSSSKDEYSLGDVAKNWGTLSNALREMRDRPLSPSNTGLCKILAVANSKRENAGSSTDKVSTSSDKAREIPKQKRQQRMQKNAH